jgi:hypothetical protein
MKQKRFFLPQRITTALSQNLTGQAFSFLGDGFTSISL